MTVAFRERLDEGEDLDDLLVEAFAVVREAARRTIGQRHYDVQLMGGMALHFGWVAEMKTGEGKTLVSTLPVYLNALAGNGVHIVTVNDYLAERDAEWMGQIHRFLGLTVGLVVARRRRLRRRSGPRTAATSPTARTTSSASTTCATTWRLTAPQMVQRGHALRHRRRGRLDPHRRGPHAAHHLAVRATTSPSSTTSSRASSGACPRDDDYEVDEEKRTVVPHRGGHRQGRAASSASRTSTTPSPANFVHQLGRRSRPRSCTSATRLPRRRRRGEDRRRVHRPHPRGAPLVRGPPPGGRGQGRREDQGGEPDPRRRSPSRTTSACTTSSPGMTGHGRRPRPPSSRSPTTCRWCRSRPTGRWSASTSRTSSTRPRSAKFNAVVDDIAERYADGPAGAGRHDLGREVRAPQPPAREAGIPHDVLNAKQHAREAADRHAGRAARRGHRRHQHGRPRRRHPPRRQPRGPGPPRRCSPRGSTPTATRGARGTTELLAKFTRPSARPRATRSASSAASTCSAPSATRAAGSTTSSGAARAARATRARAASTCRSRTTSCACSRPAP